MDFLFIGPNELPSTRVFRNAYFAGLVRPVQGSSGSTKFYNQYGNTVHAAIMWYTNLGTSAVPVELVDPEEGLAAAGKRSAWKQYQPYDNVPARECIKRATVPRGYSRPLGVPLTYLDKEHNGYCVLDLGGRSSDGPFRSLKTDYPVVKGKDLFHRYLIITRDTTVNDVTELPTCPE